MSNIFSMQLHNWFNYNVVPPVVEAIVFLVKKSLLAYLVGRILVAATLISKNKRKYRYLKYLSMFFLGFTHDSCYSFGEKNFVLYSEPPRSGYFFGRQGCHSAVSATSGACLCCRHRFLFCKIQARPRPLGPCQA